MSKIEKSFIAILILSYLFSLIIHSFNLTGPLPYYYFNIVGIVCALGLNFHYVLKSQVSYQWFLLVLFLIEWIALIFNGLHLKGAAPLSIMAFLKEGIIAVYLIVSCLNPVKKLQTLDYLKITIGITIIFKLLIPTVLLSNLQTIAYLISCLIISIFIFNILNKQQVTKPSEKYIMVLVLALSVIQAIEMYEQRNEDPTTTSGSAHHDEAYSNEAKIQSGISYFR